MKENMVVLQNGSTVAIVFKSLKFFRTPDKAETAKILSQLAVLLNEMEMLQKVENGNLLFEISESAGPDLIIVFYFIKKNEKSNPCESKKTTVRGYVTMDGAMEDFLMGPEVKNFVSSCCK